MPDPRSYRCRSFSQFIPKTTARTGKSDASQRFPQASPVEPQTARVRVIVKYGYTADGRVGACISNAAENADCRCQRLGGPTVNFCQAVFHKSRRTARVKQLYCRPFSPSSPVRFCNQPQFL